MRIAICDDDKKCSAGLYEMLTQYMLRKEINGFEIVEHDSGAKLLEGYTPGTFEIIFLGVEMPDLDGFDTAKKIREADLDVDIVFISYLQDEMQRGFDYNAKGYLYKAVTQEQIDERMDKLINERLRSSGSAFHKIKLKKGGNVLLFLPRVLYFESYSHDISAVSENETHIFIGSITNLTKELKNKGFLRISQSYLVNIEHVFNVSGNQVTIKNGNELTAGRAYKQALTAAIANRGK